MKSAEQIRNEINRTITEHSEFIQRQRDKGRDMVVDHPEIIESYVAFVASGEELPTGTTRGPWWPEAITNLSQMFDTEDNGFNAEARMRLAQATMRSVSVPPFRYAGWDQNNA